MMALLAAAHFVQCLVYPHSFQEPLQQFYYHIIHPDPNLKAYWTFNPVCLNFKLSKSLLQGIHLPYPFLLITVVSSVVVLCRVVQGK